jgi:hypothetical protein
MFGMIGLAPDWEEVLDEEGPAMSKDDIIEQDDIVEVATRDLKPVLCTARRWDELAQLRVLGETQTESEESSRTLYLLLVTDVDASKVAPSVRVDKWRTIEYEVEDRFFGESAVIVSELHIRRIVLKQNGRFCSRCKDYNRDVRLPKTLDYVCKACMLNPYR